MGFLGIKRDQTFGLDVDSGSVKIVQVSKAKGSYEVTSVARVPVVMSSEQENLDESSVLVQAIRRCMDQTNIHTRHAVTGLSGPEVVISNFEFPKLDASELKQAVQLEAEQYCHADADQAVVDYHLIPTTVISKEQSDASAGEKVSGLMVASAKRTVEDRRRLIQLASLNCAIVDVDGLALLNCFQETEKLEDDQVIAILNVGQRLTNLIVVRENDIPFFRNLPYGEEQIVTEIAEEHEELPGSIRDFLYRPEMFGDPILNLSVSLSHACKDLINDIMETLRYVFAQKKIKYLDRMYICGDFVLVKGFEELLNLHLPSKVSVWNPFREMSYGKSVPGKELIETMGPAYAVAAGLAMRTL